MNNNTYESTSTTVKGLPQGGSRAVLTYTADGEKYECEVILECVYATGKKLNNDDAMLISLRGQFTANGAPSPVGMPYESTGVVD